MKPVCFLLTILGLLITLPLYAQTGPGGVGNSTGTSRLIFWLDANSEIFSDNGVTPANNEGTLQQWNDLSGYNNHAVQTIEGRKPTWNTNIQNGYPSVTFSSSTQNYLQLGVTLNPATTGYTYFTVFNSTDGAQQNLLQQTNGTSQGRTHLIINSGTSALSSFIGGVRQESTINHISGNWTISNTSFISNGSSSSITFSQNGTSGGTQGTPQPESTTGYWLIGVNKTLNTQWLNANVSEAIMFDTQINSAQSIIVYNYLAAKYAITLSSYDIYDEDNPENGNFDHDVAGIGRIDASNTHDDAQGTGIVRISNPSDLGDDEFLMWGHDNGTLQVTNTTDVPDGVLARLDRVWRVSESNSASSASVDVGNIDMQWDLNSFGSVNGSDLRLLIDDNNNGIFSDDTPIGGAIDLGGGIFAFNNVPGEAGGIRDNTRFTIGTTQTPLPIELVYFDVKAVDNRYVKLQWQTASEIINDFFTIERSIDGMTWISLQTVNGAGNSSTTLDYVAFDYNPLSDISYYRLKQTDYDGQFSYSGIKSINISLTIDKVLVWPNPSSGEVYIQYDKLNLDELKVYNTLGHDVTNNIGIYSFENHIVLNLTQLKSGLYFIKTPSGANMVYKQ